jgi:hypothetical protein
MKFTTLLHHVTVDLLRDSFSSLKRKAAPGVDGVTWQAYEAGLESRLADLQDKIFGDAKMALTCFRRALSAHPHPSGYQAPECGLMVTRSSFFEAVSAVDCALSEP